MIETTYRIPQSVIDDTRAFRGEVEKFLAGDTLPIAFRGIRVPMGIYEQRENDTYMVRVRCAAGVFLPHQAKTVAELAEAYGNGIVHVTTRQDMQIHGVRVEDTPDILDRLLDAGLSSRGGGGNTVRNISACPCAGVCVDEAFDVTPYALALTEYLMRERGNFNLPRKFKAAFSGCGRDCGLCSVADLGFFAHERDGARGFAVYAGGGMGAHSALGIPIEEFVPAEAIFEVAEAVKRLFDKHGDRANRNRARLRFVVERLGPDEFRRLYREELDKARQEMIEAPEIRNVSPQRREGMFSMCIPLALGDISSGALSMLASKAQEIGDGTIRATQDQDLQLRSISEQDLDKLFTTLRGIESGLVTARSVRCTACAGASTCKLGLCLSRGLAEAVEEELKDIEVGFDAPICISGCPNACGHHPIAAIGLYGGAARVHGRLVPFYTIVAGGRSSEIAPALARPVAKVPARAVPSLLRDFFAAAESERSGDEPLDALIARWGVGYLSELGCKYELVPSYDEAPEFYRDFGMSADFSLAGRGPGECGAGVTDVIALDIDESKRAVGEARLYDAVVAAARALLVTRGLEPGKDREVFAAFSEHLIGPGWVARKTQDLVNAAMDFKLGDRAGLDDLRDQVEVMVKRVEELFLSLDSNLNFRVDPIAEPGAHDQPGGDAETNELDLRGVACPMNFVRAKVHLEQIEVGGVLDILLDDGEPVRNVPASFAEQGHEVLSVTNEGTHHRVKVRRQE